MLRVGSSQHSPRIMRAWGRMRNFIISKRMCGLKGQGSSISMARVDRGGAKVKCNNNIIRVTGITGFYQYLHNNFLSGKQVNSS